MNLTPERRMLIILDFAIFFVTLALVILLLAAIFGGVSWWVVMGVFVLDVILVVRNLQLTARS